jgi:methylated-DNA-[protein]-cysteine S-methyltransferase
VVKIITYNSAAGSLLIGVHEHQLVLCDWTNRTNRIAIDKRITQYLKCNFVNEETELHKTISTQLDAYFKGTLQHFDVPIKFCGTSFQQEVWQALTAIEYGKTSTYLQQSKTLGNPLAIRAVASANGANALSIIIPCHRIIGSKGELIGYAGGLAAKQFLLDLEQGQKLVKQGLIEF